LKGFLLKGQGSSVAPQPVPGSESLIAVVQSILRLEKVHVVAWDWAGSSVGEAEMGRGELGMNEEGRNFGRDSGQR